MKTCHSVAEQITISWFGATFQQHSCGYGFCPRCSPRDCLLPHQVVTPAFGIKLEWPKHFVEPERTQISIFIAPNLAHRGPYCHPSLLLMVWWASAIEWARDSGATIKMFLFSHLPSGKIVYARLRCLVIICISGISRPSTQREKDWNCAIELRKGDIYADDEGDGRRGTNEQTKYIYIYRNSSVVATHYTATKKYDNGRPLYGHERWGVLLRSLAVSDGGEHWGCHLASSCYVHRLILKGVMVVDWSCLVSRILKRTRHRAFGLARIECGESSL